MARHGLADGKVRWYERLPVPPAVLVLCLAIVVGVGIWGIAGILASPHEADPPNSAGLSEPKDGPAADEEPGLTFAQDAVDAASGTMDINLFSALDGTSEVLADDRVAAVEKAIEGFAAQGYQTGFVVLDLSTGRGIGYNADTEFFCASTIKAPFVTFLHQELLDSGEISLLDELEKDVEIGGTGVMIDEDDEVYALEEVLTDTIVYSDNIGYAMLREHYEGPDWDEWTIAAGVPQGISVEGYYPFCSAKDLAQYWLAIESYLSTDTAGASRVKSLLGSTETSFLREALGSGAEVYAKAGFEMDSEYDDLGALNEAGIVSGPAGDYLIVVMSDADFDDEWMTDNAALITDLIEALDALHADVLAE